MIDDAPEIEISDWARLPKHPVVSVQMLTYNHSAHIAQAIEGVLAQQTDFPIELLIAEDCSTDETRAIAERYQRAHPDVVRIVTGSVNIGARANRHRVAKRIRGEFVAFCEGDDYWTDAQKLQRQVDWLRTHPEAGAIHTDFDHLVRIGRVWRRLPDYQKNRFAGGAVPAGRIFSTLLRGSFVQMCTLCVRTSIDREFVADFLKDSYPIGDWPLSIYVSATHEVGYLPLSTAVYRRVAGSMMNSGRKARARLTAAYIPMIEDICDRMRVASAERSQALLPLYRALYSLAFFAGDEVLFGRAVDWLRKNDKAFLSPWQRRIKTWLVRAPMICSMLAAKHEIWLAFDEWRRYRPEHP